MTLKEALRKKLKQERKCREKLKDALNKIDDERIIKTIRESREGR